jgi:hypothetical protein
VESRHPDQPPAADLPHAPLGINALAEAAALRVENRLPMRQVCSVLGRSGLRLCAAAVAKQLQRLGRWLGGEYDRIKQRLRRSASVNAGAHAWAVLASVLRTAKQQGRNLVDTLKELMTRHWAGQEPGLLTAE